VKSRILVIEDEERIREFLRRGLEAEEYVVETAEDGTAGLELVKERVPDLVLLDLMLPGMDGLEVCQKIRSEHDVPILMLTARDGVADRVEGLNKGADDYLVKPFAFDELLARVRALLRRSQAAIPTKLRFMDLELDTGTHLARREDRAIQLTTKEFELLELFMLNQRQVLTRDQIYEKVWGYDFGGESNVIEVYVRYLRQKTEEGGERRLLHTVRGTGYVLREEE